MIDADRELFPSNPNNGIVYTKPEIVNFIFDNVGYIETNPDIAKIRLLDIGCGYGQFIGEATRRLISYLETISLSDIEKTSIIKKCLKGVEINQDSAEYTRFIINRYCSRLFQSFASDLVDVKDQILIEDFLHWETPLRFNLIIGNIPYVKYDSIKNLPQCEQVEWLRDHFQTFRGRADYSIAFFEKAISLLTDDGQIAIITSNRFTQSNYGMHLRKHIATNEFKIIEIDLSKTKAFLENVSAYSSIFLLSKTRYKHSRYLRLFTLSPKTLNHITEIGIQQVRNSNHYLSYLREIIKDVEIWSPLPRKISRLLSRISGKYAPLDESGFIIRKGPATGFNDCYIRTKDKFNLSESSQQKYLLPVYHSGSSKLSVNNIPDVYLLSVFNEQADLIDFNLFPEDIQIYLNSFQSELKQRYIVQNLGYEWWRTIDKYNPNILSEEKILIPDLQIGKYIRYDNGSLFPDHSIVYITGPSWKMNSLIYYLQSPLIDLYRIHMRPMMNSGSPRASSSDIKKIPYPDFLNNPDYQSQDLAELYSNIGLSEDETNSVKEIYNLYMPSHRIG